MTRRVSAAIGAMLLFAITACGGGDAGESSGTTLRLGVSGSTGSLNLFAGPNADYDTLANLYPILVDYDLGTVEPLPGFATSWERSADGLTWTFRTRPDVRWSDGQPLTARDAEFTFDTLIKYQDGPTANYADFVKEIDSVDAPDANTPGSLPSLCAQPELLRAPSRHRGVRRALLLQRGRAGQRTTQQRDRRRRHHPADRGRDSQVRRLRGLDTIKPARRSQISQVRHLGFADSGTTIVPPALAKWHASEVTAAQFDLQRANALLDSAGYPRAGEGLRMADGREMSYQVLITPDFDRTFEILRSDFRQIGVQLQAQSLDPQALAAAVQDNGYANYDLALTSVQAAPTDPDFSLSSFTCRTRGIFNLTGYCDEEYDRLYELQRTAASEDRRVDLVHQLQEMIYRSRAFVVFDYPNQIDAWNGSWTGFQQATDGIFSGLTPNALAGTRPAA